MLYFIIDAIGGVLLKSFDDTELQRIEYIIGATPPPTYTIVLSLSLVRMTILHQLHLWQLATSHDFLHIKYVLRFKNKCLVSLSAVFLHDTPNKC